MQMLVTPMRRNGIALNLDERRRYRAIKGDVRVRAEIDPELGRSTTVARLLGVMPLDPEYLPQLRDATLSSMAPLGFVLSGIEYIDGCAYAQSWWCRAV
ncbi:hypothetical protein BS643_18090 [Pseudomonas protegens]|uniref:hypothetical protein n=1 Tax=Pseudomonas protegens TaxID=380021 RepID=UPI00080715A4|nr:hypothetical protein [Pseudomonas protegens]OBZ19709.1 hypothetical protein BBH57_22955 [Pseudomonas protegens]OBZ24168.1 hypothetical protein BBH58_17210 [Pseudomonas protegens]OKK41719.1 hypothetical protein BS643_18090 [Pseudomonas protegens]OKK45154.1 hypothetical protein BS644_22860 [Pseudomonas protegens]OKK55819.1 hypothetical protein BS646_29810 [Pseudomonas protegens]